MIRNHIKKKILDSGKPRDHTTGNRMEIAAVFSQIQIFRILLLRCHARPVVVLEQYKTSTLGQKAGSHDISYPFIPLIFQYRRLTEVSFSRKPDMYALCAPVLTGVISGILQLIRIYHCTDNRAINGWSMIHFQQDKIIDINLHIVLHMWASFC